MTTAMRLKEEGIKEGIKENKIEIVKKMIQKGYNTGEICEITGLLPNDIEQLEKELTKKQYDKVIKRLKKGLQGHGRKK